MKRYLSIFLVLLLLISALTGCGAKSESDTVYAQSAAPEAAPEAAAPEEYAEMEYAEEVLYDETSSEADTGSTAMPANQKLIRTVYMEAETLSMTSLMNWLDERVANLNGYYEQKSVRRSGSRDDGSYYQYADLTIRVPAENLDQFVSQVGEKANIVSTSESTENVTLTYVSTQSRVEALETEQKRLLELLENAETMEDLLTIESRLTDVRWELENYASQLRVLDNQVNYSTIYLSVWEVDEPTVIVERTVWQKIGDGFSENAGDMWDGLVNFFIWLITVIPYLIPLALIGAVVLLVLKMCKKLKIRRKSKKNKPADADQQ